MVSDSNPPVLTSANLLAYKRSKGLLANIQPPQSVILVYQSSVVNTVLRRHPARKVSGFAGQFHLLKHSKERVGLLSGFGIGAPVTGALVDELAAWGVKQFIGLGLAAGLQPNLQSGDIVLCKRTQRDEGTSKHYAADDPWANASEALLQRWGAELQAGGHSFIIGDGWTTDAPYRELRNDVLAHAAAGVQTVDMEASAFMTVAAFYGCQAACGFAVVDSLAGGTWAMGDAKQAERGLEQLLESAIAFLSHQP